MKWYISPRTRLGLALLWASLVSVGFYVFGALNNHSGEFGYLIWNLFLAWLPLVFALLLKRSLRRKLWSSWTCLVLTVLWVVFLPNSFYMISDFVHVQDVQRADLLYDVVMFTSFIFVAALLGFISVYIVHRELNKRLSVPRAGALVALTLLTSSFAIYLGHDLRWNTWDVVADPAGILVDVSNRVLSPRAHPQVLSTTLSFFVLLGTLYLLGWYAARTLRQQRTED